MKEVVSKIFITVFFILFLTETLKSQNSFSQEDSIVFNDYTGKYHSHQKNELTDLFVETAKYFLGKPYVPFTLERNRDENVVINLSEFDCTTFVESCLSLAIMIKSGDISSDNYMQILKKIRYRNGIIEDYSSRLHYVSDWIYEMTKIGLLENISENFGGEFENKTINFMSEHPKSYKQLSDKDILRKITITEKNTNKRGGYYIIKKDKIKNISSSIRNGDIIAFATTISGLDFSHIGIAYYDNGRLTFIHASSSSKKIVVDKKSLSDYCAGLSTCDGITVLRLNNKYYHE